MLLQEYILSSGTLLSIYRYLRGKPIYRKVNCSLFPFIDGQSKLVNNKKRWVKKVIYSVILRVIC